MGEAERGGAPGGLLEHLRELFGAGAEYLRARLELAGIEAKEAMVHLGIMLGLVVLALAVIIFGYLFFCIAVVALLAWLLHVQVGWILLAVALAHFGVAAACLLFARTRLTTAMFSGTLSELKKDQQWLSTSR